MGTTLPDLRVVPLHEVYPDREGRLDVYRDGDADRLRDAVGMQPAPVALDLRELVYLGYSFSKHTIVRLLQEAPGPVCAVGSDDERFLDGLSDALAHGRTALYLAPSVDAVGISGGIVGAVTPFLAATFGLLLTRGPLGTGELATDLGVSPQNAKSRVDRLLDLRLVSRSKVTSPTGGKEWSNATLFAAPPREDSGLSV